MVSYDAELAERFQRLLAGVENVTSKRMMGGVCFFLNGNMVGGADRSKAGERRFMFRVGKENEARATALTGGEPVVHGGRRLGGFYFVDADRNSGETIGDWAALAVSHARGLPPK